MTDPTPNEVRTADGRVLDAVERAAYEALMWRLTWPSTHWGTEKVNAEAWPHLAISAVRGARTALRAEAPTIAAPDDDVYPWTAVGWDDRKTLSDIWQKHAPLPEGGPSDATYSALVAVAQEGARAALMMLDHPHAAAPSPAGPFVDAVAAAKHLATTTGTTFDEAARGLATIAKAFPATAPDEREAQAIAAQIRAEAHATVSVRAHAALNRLADRVSALAAPAPECVCASLPWRQFWGPRPTPHPACPAHRVAGTCPSCGSPDRLTVRPPCSLDQFDADAWHRSRSAAAPEQDVPRDSDEYAPDPEWEYGFRLDGEPTVFSAVFGLPFTSLAAAQHAGEKSWTRSIEYLRHPKGSIRYDDWEPIPTEGA